MSSGTNNCNIRDQRLKSTDSQIPTILSNLSYHTTVPSRSRLEPEVGLSSTGWIRSKCTTCLSEPYAAGSCRILTNAEEHQTLSGCVDPVCAENVCDECLEDEDYCDECVVHCGSDCGVAFRCDQLDVGVDDSYAFGGSDSELFGDQTAQTFGFGRPLPQLPTENTMVDSGDLGQAPSDANLSTLPNYSMDQGYPGSFLQPNLFPHFPWSLYRQRSPPQAITSSTSSCKSSDQGPPSHELTFADISPLACKATSPVQSSKPTHGSLDPTDTTANAHYDHVNLSTEHSDSAGPFHPTLRCQWADLTGEPCGKTLALGEDMHEHLKSAHGVKSEVFCRWVGCSVGVLKASPHRFASSVERHTWGHSGYRPYKCSACNEGFAAASVRDEHYTNIHLRKKVFACDMCSHQCTSATNLKRHKDDKHSAERFQCEFCNQNGKRRLFPRGPNLARHLRNCKYVMAQFPEAAAAGKTKADWLPPGYRRGHHGMDRAKVTPPQYLPAQYKAWSASYESSRDIGQTANTSCNAI